MTVNFSDNVGHLFALDVYTSMPIGYLTFLNSYIFWIDNEYTNYLSINNYYIKLIRLVVDEEPKTINISIESDVFSLISPNFFKYKTNDIKIDRNDIKKILTTDDLYAIEVDGQYLIPFYVCAYSKEESTWVSNVLINIDDSCFCPITIGAQIKDEQEELIINGKNMGVNLPKNIINAVYQGSTYNVVNDETLYNLKVKEYLINYIGIKGECGNYRSAKKSLDWFGWGDKISLSQLLRINNDFHESYLRDQFSIDSDNLESYKYFRTSTYLTLLVKENIEINDESIRGQIKNRYYTEADVIIGKNGKTYDKTTYERTRIVSPNSKEAFAGLFNKYVDGVPYFYEEDDIRIGLDGNSYDKYTYDEIDIETGKEVNIGDINNINNDHSFWGEWKPKMQSLFNLQRDVIYELNINENVIYKRSYYDFIYDDLALKLSLLARYYETYFLPIHLSVHSATIEYLCHTNDIKLTSFYNGQHISNGVNMVSDKSVKVIFPNEQELLLYKQEHIIDEQYNIFHKSKINALNDKNDCAYDSSEEIYEINDDKCDVYVDDICCQLPIRILPNFDLNNKNIIKEIESYNFTPIFNNDAYKFIYNDYSKFFKCVIVLARNGNVIFNSIFDYVFKGQISKQFEYNDCLIYNENNKLIKVNHNLLEYEDGEFYFKNKKVNPYFDYITVTCKDDNEFIVPLTYMFKTETDELLEALQLTKNNRIVVNKDDNIINNSKYAENNLYEVVYIKHNLIGINIEHVLCDYDSFLIVPRYFKLMFDATFWYNKHYGIELCVNDNWYHYDFKMIIPKFIVNVGTLQYRNTDDINFAQYVEDKYNEEDIVKIGSKTYDKETIQNGRPLKNSVEANVGDKKLTLNIPIMAEPELVSVANKNFYSLMNRQQTISDIDDIVNKYWEDFYIPNNYKNLNYVIYCNIIDAKTNKKLKYTDKIAKVQEAELRNKFFNNDASCKLNSAIGLWRGNNAQLFDTYLMHDKLQWWLVIISKKNVRLTKYDMYLHFDGFIESHVDIEKIPEDEALYINDVKIYYIKQYQKFVALFENKYIDKWYNSNLFNQDDHITYNRSFVYNDNIYMFNMKYNELLFISNDINITDLFTTELITNKSYNFNNFILTGFTIHNKLLINRLQFTNVKNNRYIFGNDDIIVAKLMGSNNDLLFNMDHTNKWSFKNIDVNPNNVYESTATTNIGILSLDRYKNNYKTGYYTVLARYNIDDVTDHQQTTKISFRIEDNIIENYDYSNNDDIVIDDNTNIPLRNYSISIGDIKNNYNQIINFNSYIGSIGTINIKKYPSNAHAIFSYESSDNNIISISASGQYTLNSIGKADIHIIAKDMDGNVLEDFIDQNTGELIHASRTINVNIMLDQSQLYYFVCSNTINKDVYDILENDNDDALINNDLTLESLYDLKSVETILSGTKDIEEIRKKCANVKAGQYYCILTLKTLVNNIYWGTADDIADDDYGKMLQDNQSPIYIKDTNYAIIYAHLALDSQVSAKIK